MMLLHDGLSLVVENHTHPGVRITSCWIHYASLLKFCIGCSISRCRPCVVDHLLLQVRTSISLRLYTEYYGQVQGSNYLLAGTTNFPTFVLSTYSLRGNPSSATPMRRSDLPLPAAIRKEKFNVNGVTSMLQRGPTVGRCCVKQPHAGFPGRIDNSVCLGIRRALVGGKTGTTKP